MHCAKGVRARDGDKSDVDKSCFFYVYIKRRRTNSNHHYPSVSISVRPSVHIDLPSLFPSAPSHNLMVGNPLMAYFLAASLNRVASIFPT